VETELKSVTKFKPISVENKIPSMPIDFPIDDVVGVIAKNAHVEFWHGL
jgi:hypothetical protein